MFTPTFEQEEEKLVRGEGIRVFRNKSLRRRTIEGTVPRTQSVFPLLRAVPSFGSNGSLQRGVGSSASQRRRRDSCSPVVVVGAKTHQTNDRNTQ